MPTREAVYAALDTERAYQDKRWGATLSGNRPAGAEGPGGHRSVDEFILYIAGYADQLKAIGAVSNDTAAKLEFVRKVGGLCVACMEQHGAPHRKTPQ